MRKLFFAAAILLSACNENSFFSSSYEEKNDVTLRTLNSKNDLQVCYDPINCLFVPQSLQRPSLDFLSSQHKNSMTTRRMPASIIPTKFSASPYDSFSPLVAEKIESLKTIIKKPITLAAATRNPSNMKSVRGGVDFHVEGLKPEELKQYCEQVNANSIVVYNSYIHCDWLTQPVSKDKPQKDVGLHVDGELKKGESIVLSVDSFDKEAGSELFVKWDVTHRGQTIDTADVKSVTLNNLKRGLYQVKAHIGGQTTESFSLIVE